MLDAVVGAVIMVVATTALVLSVEVVESSLGSAGRQPLNLYERELLQKARRGDNQSMQLLEDYLTDEGRPRTWQ